LVFALWSQAQTNVIFVTIDDLSRESLGIHGCTVSNITPHIDALAYSGLRFEHCHVQSANCTPSRNIMSSGLYQQRNRVFSLGKEGAGNHLSAPALPDVFRAAGYHTGLMGKNGHMSAFDPYSGFDVEYDNYGSTRDPQNIYNKLTAAFSAADSLGKPLYFNLNIFDPHTGWYKWDHKNGVFKTTTEVDPSIIYTENDVPYPSWFPPLSAAEQIDSGTGNSLLDEVAAYYNTVKRADDSIGKMMQAIDDAGKAGNTIIVVVSDHGVQLPGAKTQLYDHSTRSPLFVKWPGVTASNTVNSTEMIASFDLLPTFAEMIGQPIPAGVDGRSFAPIIKGETVPEWRGYIYKQQNDRNKMRAIQTTDLLYIYNPWSNGSDTVGTVATGMLSWRLIKAAGDAGNTDAAAYANHFLYRTVEELYDITTDPDCLTNLFANPAYATELAMMQNLMEQEMIASGDNLVLPAFQDRTNPAANAQFVADQAAFQNAQANDPNYVRDVFYNPHDDWQVIGHTLFEPAGEWNIWTPETTGINLNTSSGDAESGDNCIEFNGSVANVSRLIVSNALDTSVFDQLKLETIFIDGGAFSGGATLSFQYNDGSGWQTFQTLGSAGEKNLTFDLSAIGSPDAILFGIQADMNGSGGSIYMDHTRFTAWQDWTSAPTNTAFDASDKGVVRVAFEFETQNFSDTDKLLLEYYDGAAWTLLEDYDFSYVLLTNKTYSDTIDMYDTSYTFPTNMEFRFRSESTGSGQAFTIENLSIQTRQLSEDATITVPPTATPDSYSETDPRAIVVVAPGILDNDVSGTGSNLTATLVTDAANGILEFNPDGSFVYAATNGYIGPDAFTYVAYDGNAFSATTTVSLSINVPVVDPVLFTDDFETATTGGGGNGNGLPDPAKGWLASGGYWIGASDGTGGTVGMRMRAGASLLTKALDTTGYTDVTLLFDGKSENLAAGQEMTIEWSSNGGSSWSLLGSVPITVLSYQPFSFSLPAGADDNADFAFRFNGNSDANSKRGYFDNVVVTGAPPASAGTITNFADWASLHGVAANNEYTFDYAFNINPWLDNHYKLSASGNSGLPAWELSQTDDKLAVEFVRRKQASDLTYKAQFTDSLMTNWTDAVSSETITPIDDEFERVSVADDVTTAIATNRFGRVVVIKN
jgi:N-sulfoglucosamine sulfohydrolase